MTMLLDPFLARWRMTAVVAAAAMLAIAHAFQTFGGYQPCTLCLKQREVYWAVLGLGAGFMILVRLPGGPRWREATCWVLGLVFLMGLGLAIYHAGAEWKFWPGPKACSASGGSGDLAAGLKDFMAGEKVRPPACDEAPWVFLGLSMAGWNAVASAGLVAMSVLAALRERTRRD